MFQTHMKIKQINKYTAYNYNKQPALQGTIINTVLMYVCINYLK